MSGPVLTNVRTGPDKWSGPVLSNASGPVLTPKSEPQVHLKPSGFGSLIRLRSQTAPGLQFSRYRRLAGYFNHTPMYQATALRSESRKNTRPHSVRDCRRYSRLICGSTRVRIPPRRVAKKETISDQGTYHGTAVGVFHAFSIE